MKKTVLSILSVLFVLVLVAMVATTNVFGVGATGQDVCPETEDSVKFDGLSGTSGTFSAPDGYLITSWCAKASTTLMSGSVNPPAASVTITSTVTNQNGRLQDLSHVVLYLVKIEDPTLTPTNTPTNTPTDDPTATPTNTPTDDPTATPTNPGDPTLTPTVTPTLPGDPTTTPTVVDDPRFECDQVLGWLEQYPPENPDNAQFWINHSDALRWYDNHGVNCPKATKVPSTGSGGDNQSNAVGFLIGAVVLIGILALLFAALNRRSVS